MSDLLKFRYRKTRSRSNSMDIFLEISQIKIQIMQIKKASA